MVENIFLVIVCLVCFFRTVIILTQGRLKHPILFNLNLYLVIMKPLSLFFFNIDLLYSSVHSLSFCSFLLTHIGHCLMFYLSAYLETYSLQFQSLSLTCNYDNLSFTTFSCSSIPYLVPPLFFHLLPYDFVFQYSFSHIS